MPADMGAGRFLSQVSRCPYRISVFSLRAMEGVADLST